MCHDCLEYGNGITQDSSKLDKLTKIKDRLVQLDFEEVQRRQLELRDDHIKAGKQIECLSELQQKQEQLTKELQYNTTLITTKRHNHRLHQQDMQYKHSDLMWVTDRRQHEQTRGSQ